MASRTSSHRCLNCLLQLPRPSCRSTPLAQLSFVPSAAFSSTVLRSYPAPKAKAPPRTAVSRNVAVTHHVKRSVMIKKKEIPKKVGRPIATGERKALRKRIVLSNINALEVTGLSDLSAANVLEESSKGQVMGIPGPLVDQLRAVGAFKPKQHWGLFRRPAILIRSEAVELGRRMEAIEKGDKTTVRAIITGVKGVGKTTMALQAISTAFLRGWIVVAIPEAQELTNATTAYSPLPAPEGGPTIYTQKNYLSSLLSTLLNSNPTLLTNLTLTLTHDLPVTLPPDTTLHRLATLGARDAELAHPIFTALWAELTAANRPPLLLTFDNIAHLMRSSLYRAPDSSLLHAHDLYLPRHLVRCLQGKEAFLNGGVVLGATSVSHHARSDTFDRLLLREEDQKRPEEDAQQLHLRPVDERVLDLMTTPGLEIWRLPPWQRDELRGWLNYAAESGIVRAKIADRAVAEWWGLSGGVPSEVVRSMSGLRL